MYDIKEMKEVKSSSISHVGYDPQTETLYIRFHGAGLYSYPEVAPEEHKAFMEAESAGKYFHANIRGKYKGVKVKEADPVEEEPAQV